MSKFYGDNKIKSMTEDGDHIVLDFGGGKTEKISKKMSEVSITKKPMDLTALWDKQLGAVTKDILQVLLDWDIKMEQLDYLFNLVKSSLEYNNKKAHEVLWGKELGKRTMSDVDKVLKMQSQGSQTNKENE